jgi:hypothetical protein
MRPACRQTDVVAVIEDEHSAADRTHSEFLDSTAQQRRHTRSERLGEIRTMSVVEARDAH